MPGLPSCATIDGEVPEPPSGLARGRWASIASRFNVEAPRVFLTTSRASEARGSHSTMSKYDSSFPIPSKQIAILVLALLPACQAAPQPPSLTQPPTIALPPISPEVGQPPTPDATSGDGTAMASTPTTQSPTSPDLARVPVNLEANEGIVFALFSDEGGEAYLATQRWPLPELDWNSVQLVGTGELAPTSPPQLTHRLVSHQAIRLFPGFEGEFSPSGRYRLVFDGLSQPERLTVVSLVDTTGASPKSELLRIPGPYHSLGMAQWLSDESRVLIDVWPMEFGRLLYLHDLRDGTTRSTMEIAGYEDPSLTEWSLSPDGSTLAVDGDGLWLISLDEGKAVKVDRFAESLVWSHDGTKLYFHAGTEYGAPDSLVRLDLGTGALCSIVDESVLMDSVGEAPLPFEVSQAGDQFLFWDSFPETLWWMKAPPMEELECEVVDLQQ